VFVPAVVLASTQASLHSTHAFLPGSAPAAAPHFAFLPLLLLLLLAVTQPLYGFSNKDPAKYLRVAGHPDLVCLQDPEVSFNQVSSPAPCVPQESRESTL
jgi:hypothetical protein